MGEETSLSRTESQVGSLKRDYLKPFDKQHEIFDVEDDAQTEEVQTRLIMSITLWD